VIGGVGVTVNLKSLTHLRLIRRHINIGNYYYYYYYYLLVLS